jgi:putative copper export protein
MTHFHGLHAVISFLGFWALFMFSGLLIARIWLAPQEAFALPELAARWRQMLLESYALIAFAGVMLLLVRTGEMDEGTLAKVVSDLPLVLTKTHFGAVWSVHLVVLLMLWAGVTVLMPARPSRAWGAAMVAATLVLAFTYSASSHAADGGDFTLAELSDWAHVVATSAWGGGILVCVVLILPQLRARADLAATVAGRLSALSAAALLLVLATGLYGATRQLPAWDTLLATDYGRILSVKLGLVGVLTVIGAFNRYVVVARLRRVGSGAPLDAAAPARLLFRTLAVDAVFVALALMMAAILIQNEP